MYSFVLSARVILIHEMGEVFPARPGTRALSIALPSESTPQHTAREPAACSAPCRDPRPALRIQPYPAVEWTFLRASKTPAADRARYRDSVSPSPTGPAREWCQRASVWPRLQNPHPATRRDSVRVPRSCCARLADNREPPLSRFAFLEVAARRIRSAQPAPPARRPRKPTSRQKTQKRSDA